MWNPMSHINKIVTLWDMQQCRQIIKRDGHLNNRKVKNVGVLVSHFPKDWNETLIIGLIANVAQWQQLDVKHRNLNFEIRDPKFT